MQPEFDLLAKTERAVAAAFRDYLGTEASGDPELISQTYIDLSSATSNLFSLHLRETDWDDGWLDGVPFHSITSPDCHMVQFAGLLVWCGEDGLFYLEPFQSRFHLNPSSDDVTSYLLCFRRRRADRQYVKYDSSISRVSRQIAIPDAADPIDESEWLYVFHRKPPSGDVGAR